MLRDIHARQIQMWAGCIWVPIYEVMTRKHLTMVTLEENLEMAADIGIDATTSLDEAFAAAMERHGADAKVVVLPFARYQLPRNCDPHGVRRSRLHVPEAPTPDPGVRPGRHPRIDDDRRVPADVSGGEAARLMSQLAWPCAHCGGAFREPLTLAAKRTGTTRARARRVSRPRPGGPTHEQIVEARRKGPR